MAWTPALGAGVYQVQWSKTQYPFVAENDPRTNTKGFLTFSTSSVLPLRPGTWWYRVRGFDYNLPTGVQQMSWSDPQKLVVSTPRFKIVPTPSSIAVARLPPCTKPGAPCRDCRGRSRCSGGWCEAITSMPTGTLKLMP